MSEVIYTTTKTTTATATTTLPPTFDSITSTLADNFVFYLNYLGKFPGGNFLLKYIKSSYQNDPIRSLFELALFMFAIHYFLSSKRKENKSELVKFSQREMDELINEWNPKPLIEETTPEEKWQLQSIPILKGQNGSHINIESKSLSNVINLASFDFLNFNENSNIREASKAVISTTGVGACSPPNFYGTQDSHVRLEEDLADYLDGEQSILYGQDFVSATSVLPAFVKRGDLCVVDTGVNFAIQKALVVSRCDIEWYNHNDMDHLEQILSELKPSLDEQKPLRRRFIITEGLFANTGELTNLPKIVELKNKFKYRIFLDETYSVGTLGKTGKGVVEHFDIPRSEIAITIGSFATSFASSGGFCVGVTPMIHHQRLSSLAYVFSAALPPYSAKAVSQSIKEITDNVDAKGYSLPIKGLHDLIDFTYTGLSKSLNSSPFMEILSNKSSSIIHLCLRDDYRLSLSLPNYYGNLNFLKTGKPAKFLNPFNEKYNLENFLLQKIIDKILAKSNILITRSKNLLVHENMPIFKPHLLVMINRGVSQDEYSKLFYTLGDTVDEVCGSIKDEFDLNKLQTELENYE